MSLRWLIASALIGLAVWLVAEAVALTGLGHAVVSITMMLTFVLPLFAALNVDAVKRFGHQEVNLPTWVPGLFIAGGINVAIGNLLFQSINIVVGIGLSAVAAIVYAIAIMKSLPKESLVNIEEDPLTKGDDACFKHITFSHRFLAIGMLILVTAASTSFFSPDWAWKLAIAASHVILIGYALLSTYGIAHLWVPRFSGVPAIAAGAIKGELHTTLLGLTGLTIGILTGIKGIMAGLGFFVFVGFFTFMGVIGANMMRNKSKTQRVTPEFVYIPWVFTAVFWLICAVLMGLFLNAVPDVLLHRFEGLRNMHVASALLGGFVQMAAGILTRAAPTSTLHFGRMQRLAFFGFNGGLTIWIAGAFNDSVTQSAIGLGLIALSIAAFAQSLAKLLPAPYSAKA